MILFWTRKLQIKKKTQKANKKKNKANQTKKTPSIYSYHNQDLVDYENIDSFTHVPDVFHFIWWYPHLTFETQKHIWVTIVSLCSYGNYERPPGAAQWASKMLLQAVRAPTMGMMLITSGLNHFYNKNSIWLSSRFGTRNHSSVNGHIRSYPVLVMISYLGVWGGVCPEGIFGNEPNY